MAERTIVIAIDGPAGAGKSTIAKQVARALGYGYIDTGAMYRAVAVLAETAGIPLDDDARLMALARGLQFSFGWDGDRHVCRIDGVDLSERIRTPAASSGASRVSANPGLREVLVDLQREMGRREGVVMEGRDIGTVVFPDAALKVFLTASARERGHRRWLELQGRGVVTDLETVVADVEARDLADSTRIHSPLRPAPDSVLVDSTELGVERVRQAILRLARARMGGDAPSPDAA